MITGVVTDRREAVVRVTALGAGGESREVESAIDTGFNGDITLSPALISELGLRLHGNEPLILGDGSQVDCDIYEGEVLWDGKRKRVFVDSCDTDSTIGMRLLMGFETTIQGVVGGLVTITRIESQ